MDQSFIVSGCIRKQPGPFPGEVPSQRYCGYHRYKTEDDCDCLF
ncbi:hypothetical protein [Limosilactobacillus reuteri]